MGKIKQTITILLIGLLLASCEDNYNDFSSFDELNTYLNEVQRKEYKTKTNAFLKENIPKMVGKWNITEMELTPNSNLYFFKNDTIFHNVGTIDINVEEKEMRNNIYQFYLNGNIKINQETIPFVSDAIMSNYKSEVAFSLIQFGYNYFPEPGINYNDLPYEYQFLDNYFLGDNYFMHFSKEGKTLVWEGMNKSAKKIILTKID